MPLLVYLMVRRLSRDLFLIKLSIFYNNTKTRYGGAQGLIINIIVVVLIESVDNKET